MNEVLDHWGRELEEGEKVVFDQTKHTAKIGIILFIEFGILTIKTEDNQIYIRKSQLVEIA